MNLVETSIRYPVTVAVGVILIGLFGLIAFYRVPVQLTPEVKEIEITVETVWPGASPQEIEREIVDEQEEQLKGIEGLVEMKSESLDSTGKVILKFEDGTDEDAALLKVANKLQQVPEYPEEAEEPVIIASGTEQNAIAWFVFKKMSGDPAGVYLERDFLEDNIKPRLERIPGVASVNVFGGQEREMQVVIDPDALAARHVTIREMILALDLENQNISAGDFDEGKRRYLVRTLGQYQSPRDVENVIIRREDGAPVYVRDVAEVQSGYKDPPSIVRQKGEPAVAMNVVRDVGANVLTVMKNVQEAAGELNTRILPRRGLSMEQVYDETDYIYSALDLVKQNIYVGGTLAVMVLLLFLRSFSSTLVIGFAIPISFVGTFLLMFLLGRNINVISLAGLAFAVGMVVDNSIVSLENIYRHRQLGEGSYEAARRGVSEVFGALMASTLTTIAVFLPVIFVKEEAGQLFKDIAVAVSCSVGLSLVIAVTVIPSLSARILSVPKALAVVTDEKIPVRGIFSLSNLLGLGSLGRSVANGFGGFFLWVYGRTVFRIGLVLVMTALALGMAWFLMPKTEYLPQGNRNLLFGIVLPPPGYNLDEIVGIGESIEGELAPFWTGTGTPQSGPAIGNFFFVALRSQAFMGAVSTEDERVRELLPVVYQALGKVPGIIPIVQQSSLFERVGEGRSIDVQITGPELPRLVELGQRIFGQVFGILPDSQLRPIPSLDLGNPEIQVVPDRDRTSSLNLSTTELGITVDAILDGIKASDYQDRGEEIDLTLMGHSDSIRRIQDLENLVVLTPTGKRVTLGSIADIRLVSGPEQINHVERQRSIIVRIIPPDRIPLETALDKIEKRIVQPLKRSGALGEFYDIQLRGTADKLSLTRKALQWNFLLAVIITYLLMASLFESFLYPLVIMFSVPLAAAGGFFGLWLLNVLIVPQALDVLTMLGFILLVGIVVNNAILLVHQSLNYMREERMDPREAIYEAVKNRVRPIFMSVSTSVFGMLPLVLFPGAGSELYRGLGSVVVGGLVISTLFTLLLVPTLLSLVLDARRAIGWGFARREVVTGESKTPPP
jgi:HAE1 family hydrophobic/amphiphilic exporter-1